MQTKRFLDALLLGALCVALAAGGCSKKDDGDGDGDGEGGLGGTTSTGPDGSGGNAPGDGDGDGDGDGQPDPVYPVLTGPGVQITLSNMAVSDEGVATVEIALADDAGRPLDREGLLTAGAISPGIILSYLGVNEDGESTQYTAYTTREKKTEGFDPAIQSSTDQGGTYEAISLGKYKYTFGTKIDINEERSHLTHTLGVYASRSFAEKTYVDNEMYSWVPDGSEVEVIQDVVTDEACTSCHTRMEFHGGSRRGVQMCNLCHVEENSINPESGNTIDFQVMIHKLHMGANLPSVAAGDPYFFIGYMGAEYNFSEVEYPGDMRDCAQCHQGSQGDRWITRPAQKPCASCHDRTYFGEGDPPEGWEAHSGGPRDDSECIVCHAGDSLEPIEGSHYTTYNNPASPVVEAEILGVTNGVAGQSPNVEFAIYVDDAAHDILTEPFSRVRLKLWGPSTDATTSLQETILDSSNSVLAPECGDPIVRPCLERSTDGFVYYAAMVIPAEAEGTYSVGMDGRYNLDGVNYPFQNPIVDIAITGAVTPRRQIVSLERCNGCHQHLAPHGGSYNQIEYCQNCHNTGFFMDPPDEINPGDEVELSSLNFKDLIHGLHSSVAYPAYVNDCAKCHEDGTTALPVVETALPSTSMIVSCPSSQADCNGVGGGPNTPVETVVSVPPESAACTSCHNTTATKVHAETNSSPSGEACATCHGPNKGQDVGVVHELTP